MSDRLEIVGTARDPRSQGLQIYFRFCNVLFRFEMMVEEDLYRLDIGGVAYAIQCYDPELGPIPPPRGDLHGRSTCWPIRVDIQPFAGLIERLFVKLFDRDYPIRELSAGEIIRLDGQLQERARRRIVVVPVEVLVKRCARFTTGTYWA
jgi:hypothetical protein